MPEHLELFATDLAAWPVHVGVIADGQKPVGEEVLEAGTPVRVGHDPACTVSIPEEFQVADRLIAEPRDDGVWLHVGLDMYVQANVLISGKQVALRGRLSDWTAAGRTLKSPFRLVSPKAIIRLGNLSILLHYDPGFAE